MNTSVKAGLGETTAVHPHGNARLLVWSQTEVLEWLNL